MKTKNPFIFVIALSLGACSPKQQERGVVPIRVETLTTALSMENTASSYVGVVEEESSAALSFPTGGTITGVYVGEGQYVGQGQLLAELDKTSAEQSFMAAKATLEQAQDGYKRMKQLYEAKSLPEVDWVEMQTKLRQSESMYEIAKKNLSDCVMRAPFSGVIGQKPVSVGEAATPNLSVMKLLKINNVKVRFSVPEQEIAAINDNGTFKVSVAALGNKEFVVGKIEKTAKADAAIHAYDVLATVGNTGQELLPGMVCQVAYFPQGAETEIVIPVNAVQQANDGRKFVWLVKGDRVSRRSVTTGRLIGNRVSITEGLSEGERIVTNGMQKLDESSKIVWQ